MAKLLSFVFFCLCIGATFGHGRGHGSIFNFFAQLFLTPTSICANTTTQASYLTSTLNLLNTFQQNTTYYTVLQTQSPNFVAYVRNSANQALLYSNCTAFVSGVKSAKTADKTAECNRQKIARDISQRLQQIPHTVTGSKGPNDLDSDENFGKHCH
ncbi:unnamed protein product [Adineta ricciae]|uniref:Uncharacterized protein n=1 Tax=Adineta ricciae TaxID=249248 RepID=A0A813NWN1_ADIRI|nr:unnamed protein product [Adineta ricciae]CAF0743887.1 unnamed protein product [Adineta ricciae]